MYRISSPQNYNEHPFFVNDVWLPAKELKKGGLLSGFKVGAISSADLRYASAHELPLHRIDSIFKFKTDTATAVYNFETKGHNDYYVSTSGVLVHNCNLSKAITKILCKYVN